MKPSKYLLNDINKPNGWQKRLDKHFISKEDVLKAIEYLEGFGCCDNYHSNIEASGNCYEILKQELKLEEKQGGGG